jgi:hypothetical protein
MQLPHLFDTLKEGTCDPLGKTFRYFLLILLGHVGNFLRSVIHLGFVKPKIGNLKNYA